MQRPGDVTICPVDDLSTVWAVDATVHADDMLAVWSVAWCERTEGEWSATTNIHTQGHG